MSFDSVSERYSLLQELGQGGFSIVYLALDTVLDRHVALKVLKLPKEGVEELTKRFLVEAKIASRLNHPNTVSVYDFGATSDGRYFIVTELLEGDSLFDYLQEGPAPLDFALEIMQQATRALQKAHEFDIIHRDVKPANIYLVNPMQGPAFVKLLDFGIAKMKETQSHTMTGQMLGTPRYMSPEQIINIKLVDYKSDIYSLGIVFFQLLTGIIPFDDPSYYVVMRQHMQKPLPPLRIPEVPKAINEEVEKLILSMTVKDASKRLDSLQVIQDRIEEWQIKYPEWAGRNARAYNEALARVHSNHYTLDHNLLNTDQTQSRTSSASTPMLKQAPSIAFDLDESEKKYLRESATLSNHSEIFDEALTPLVEGGHFSINMITQSDSKTESSQPSSYKMISSDDSLDDSLDDSSDYKVSSDPIVVSDYKVSSDLVVVSDYKVSSDPKSSSPDVHSSHYTSSAQYTTPSENSSHYVIQNETSENSINSYKSKNSSPIQDQAEIVNEQKYSGTSIADHGVSAAEMGFHVTRSFPKNTTQKSNLKSSQSLDEMMAQSAKESVDGEIQSFEMPFQEDDYPVSFSFRETFLLQNVKPKSQNKHHTLYIYIFNPNEFVANLYAQGLRKASQSSYLKFKDRLQIKVFQSFDELQAQIKKQIPKLILLELNHKESQPLQAIEVLSRTYSKQVAMIVTTSEAKYKESTLMAGANEFLVKPIQQQKLSQIVFEYLKFL